MARRSTKAEATLVTVAIIIGLPIYVVSKLGESIGWGILIAIIVGIVVLIFLHRFVKNKNRRNQLMAKYQHVEIVDKIMKRYVWEGQTAGQLKDSMGIPVDIDEKLLKTQKKEVWKYYPQGAGRYKLRITLDNDVVVGWDKKA